MKIGLSAKLLSAFLIVAVSTLTVGIIGINGAKRLSEDIDIMGTIGIPKIVNLEIIMVRLHEFRTAQRTMMSPNISNEDFKRQIATLDRARAEYRKAMEHYEQLEATEEETRLYTTWKDGLAPLVAFNNDIRSLAEELQGNVSADVYGSRMAKATLATVPREAFDNCILNFGILLDFVKDYYGTDMVIHSQKEATAINRLILGSVFGGFVFALLLGFFLSRSITKPVVRIVDGLSGGAEQIASASSQLSVSAQEIASGATEQASGIEETTSSMEELASMVKQNVENAKEASVLASKTLEGADQGSLHMEKMLVSMNEINKAAEDIKTIIDVIDDIAFQTNMLALNAAVEAARAGEAGMGFAVVADEVKNLANRSASSAKETAQMIKTALAKTEEGQVLTNQLAEIFKEITVNSRKSNEMTLEVVTASSQQDEGISQVNKAIIQLDTVVQQNASASEETASSAEELQSQVGSLRDIVVQLSTVILGGNMEMTIQNGVKSSEVKKVYAPVPDRRPHQVQHMRTHEVKLDGHRIPLDEDPEFTEEDEA